MNKLDIAKKIIKENYKDANCGIFDSRNWTGDWMTNIYIVGFKRGVSEGQKLSGFSAEEVCSILIEVGQKSSKFKLGDWIKFTPSEVYDILKEYGSNIENGFN